ncbi:MULTISPECIES: response regulator, partial [Vibrio]|uniref:response regulator n=1 Tax=Vibrio TaxID=662 RepID=UPI001CDBA964
VAAIITQPLLGQRLLKALESCAERFTQSISVVQPATRLETLPKVLVVDDNTVNQKIAGLHVTKAGFSFDVAANGEEAVDMFRTSQYCLILMDCMMPVMDGFEATKQIRAYEASLGLEKTPIIALTASVVDDDIQRCYDSGMDAYVPKPVRKEKLLHQIENVM